MIAHPGWCGVEDGVCGEWLVEDAPTRGARLQARGLPTVPVAYSLFDGAIERSKRGLGRLRGAKPEPAPEPRPS